MLCDLIKKISDAFMSEAISSPALLADMAKMEKYTDTPKFGTVVSNEDPEMLGKIKVVIPGIMEGTVDELPWVRRKNDTAFCGDDAELLSDG